MAGREPTRVGNVTIGPDGTVIRDVGADRMKQAELQLRLGEKYAQDANRDEQRADRDYQIGLNEDERAYRRTRDAAADILADRKLKAESALGFGATDSKGFATTGELVRLSKTGVPFIISNGVSTEYTGPITYPESKKEPSEDQRKAASWLTGATIGWNNMKSAMDKDPDVAFKSMQEGITSAIPFAGDAIANMGMTPARQQFTGGAADVVEGLLRAATGAGITNPETLAKIKSISPAVGDSKQRIAQKMASIPQLIQTLQSRAGRAANPEQQKKDWEEEINNWAKNTDDVAPEGVDQLLWDSMSQDKKAAFNAAGAKQ